MRALRCAWPPRLPLSAARHNAVPRPIGIAIRPVPLTARQPLAVAAARQQARHHQTQQRPPPPGPLPCPEIFDSPPDRIRNFSIIAHIDHGKSTLSDRLLEVTGTISAAEDNKQVLDKLKVERERGITVKAQTASMRYSHNGQQYLLNLIDTPGHVDFRSEVAASLAACDGVLLVVDAAQGIQAQTVANFFLADNKSLPMIPVLNKIDLPSAEPDRVAEQVQDTFGLDPHDIIYVSAKTGLNVPALLPAICDRIPPPQGSRDKPLKALLVDSWYDNYVGVVALVRLFDGYLGKGQQIVSAHTGLKYDVSEVGVMHPNQIPVDRLNAGQVGYVICGMRKSSEAHIGDTFFQHGKVVEPLPGFEELKPMVFVGAFPLDSEDFNKMADSIEKLALNDRSLTLQRESSSALGQGFRMGFLGYLHVGITVDRLRQEYGSEIIVTAPTVPYKVIDRDGTTHIISNPAEFPNPQEQAERGAKFYEPMVEATMIFPSEYLGDVIELCEENRGTLLEQNYLAATRCLLRYKLPLAHLVDDFFGKLKSRTRGYASLDYEDSGYEPSDIVKLEMLVNGDPVDALSCVLHRSLVERRGRAWVQKLKPMVERQYFEIAIQAAVGKKVIARETVKAYRKDVTAKLYGGDKTRRTKLLDKQKAGRKRMRRIGTVDIPQEAFMEFLSQS